MDLSRLREQRRYIDYKNICNYWVTTQLLFAFMVYLRWTFAISIVILDVAFFMSSILSVFITEVFFGRWYILDLTGKLLIEPMRRKQQFQQCFNDLFWMSYFAFMILSSLLWSFINRRNTPLMWKTNQVH